MNDRWYQSAFTGIFRELDPVPARAHDPEVWVSAGTAPSWLTDQEGALHVGGCGWSPEAAELGCVGEAVERLFAGPLPQDRAVEASYDTWPLDEPAVPPEAWTLFHPQQYGTAGFPFEPLDRKTGCRWICCRSLSDGEPWWAPEQLCFLFPRRGENHRFCHVTSTGLAAGTARGPLLLRALQEVVERDALMGAWWGRYLVTECCPEDAWGAEEFRRLQRPNLRWRFFRIHSPFSHHVTMVTVEGEDHEGFCHSVGSACRESRRESWTKASLEAVQGRHYVRHLRRERATGPSGPPVGSFADHAVYYSFHREQLERTVFASAVQETAEIPAPPENLAGLCARVAERSPVLFRNLTPPSLFAQGLDWRVVKVIVPGLQPLHGNDPFAHLGGALWRPRGLDEWHTLPPHPFA